MIRWYGFPVPSETPDAIVTKLNAAFNAAWNDGPTQEKLKGLGFEIAGRPPEALSNLMRSESSKWKQVIDDANIRLD